jgi:hypothetical protein
MAQISQEDMARRVASHYIRAQEEAPGQAQAPEAQQAQQAPVALPGKVGKQIVKKALDAANAAFESDDEAGFHAALDQLIEASLHEKFQG